MYHNINLRKKLFFEIFSEIMVFVGESSLNTENLVGTYQSVLQIIHGNLRGNEMIVIVKFRGQ